MENEENLPGFIFMCNRITKPECYRFRVFGLPAGRKDVVANIRRGTFLFLFDTDVKLLYGIYRADSTGRLNIEPFAFGRKFPAQVKFNIYKDCFPLPENHFKHAIIDNYQRGSNKFNPELSSGQVRNLLELFRPLHVLSTAPPRPVLNEIYSPSTLPLPPMNNVFHQTSRSSFEDSYFSRMSPNQAPRQLNYRHVNELAEPTGWAYPVNKLIPNSAAEHSVISQAPRNQLHAEAVYAVTPEGTYAARTATSYTLSHPQYTQQGILKPQPEFHTQSLHDSQHAHLNVLHPQHDLHPSMMTMHSGYVQSMPDSHHQHHNILNQPADYHSAVANTGSSHAQTVMHSGYVQSMPDPHHQHHNILNQPSDYPSAVANTGSSHAQTVTHSSYVQSMPDPHHQYHNILNQPADYHSSVANTGSSHAQTVMHSGYVQSMPDPHHQHHNILNQPADYHSAVANTGSSHAQTVMHSGYVQSMPDPHHQHQNILNQPAAVVNTGSSHAQTVWDPHYNHHYILNQQPDSYSSMANRGSNYAQSLPYPQHTHQEAQKANVVMQSHAQSSSYSPTPHLPQEVVPATRSDQGSGAIQEVISSGQQTGMGSGYYPSSTQTEANVSTQENVVSHLHSANTYSLS